MEKELLDELYTAYYRLEMKLTEIVHPLFHRIFELKSDWSNRHYHKTDAGYWQRESYPGCRSENF